MTFSTRRALGVAVVATAAGVAQLTAQGSPPPQVTVGGVVYTQYVYQLKDTVNHVNTFDITRAYVNVLGKFSGGVGTRVTADIYRNADGSLGYRLKYAFATYTPQSSPLTYKIGMIHTPCLFPVEPGRVDHADLVSERAALRGVRREGVLEPITERAVGIAVDVRRDPRAHPTRELPEHVHIGPSDVEGIDVIYRVLELIHVLRIHDTADRHLRGRTALCG